MAKWSIGCSGFHFKHWKDVFYPEKLAQSKWFNYYNNHFKTLELNATFYRFPRLPYVETWYKTSPPDFSFSVKAPQLITHYKQFLNAQQQLADFYGTIKEGLKEKLSCVLFQLPPRMAYKEEKLQRIIDSLDPAFTNVLEFRHESWWNAEVYQQLSKHNIIFCGMSHPDLPREVIKNARTVYYRLHGVPNLYQSEYDAKTLKAIVDEVESDSTVHQAFIYFNNDIDASAITNAKQMEEYVQLLQHR